MKKYQEKAIPLIFRQESKGKPGVTEYQANPDALNFLKSIQGKVAIISVAGMYRTGKSYLLNTIMLKQKGGFAVGPTTNPKTKGIWIWGKPLIYKNEKDEMINVVVMDSEGLGSTEEDINHDLRLFSLTLLLSSMFIYNTIGAIDQHAIDSLGLVLKLCDHLKTENYNDFPDFYWVLRDFSLALVGRDGKALSPNKYLENSLSPQAGDSQIRNRIRHSIRSSFVNRSCYTFVRPLTNQEELQKLDTMDIDQLRPEFTEQVLEFRKLINASIKTKKIKGKQINSSLIVELIKVYLNEINNKKLPQIETGWKYVCQRECQNVLEAVEREADESINRLLDNLPTTKKELQQKKEGILYQLQRLFNSRTLNNDQAQNFRGEVTKTLLKKMQKVEAEMKVKNSQETKSFIKKEFENIQRRLKSGQFKTMLELVHEFENFYKFYREKCPFKDEIQTGLEFLMKKFSDSSIILFKSFKAKKDQEILKMREETDRISSDFATRDERQKHEKTAAADKAAILESRIEELLKQNRELAESLAKVESDYERLKNECEQKANEAGEQAEYQLISLRKKLLESQDQIQQIDCKRIMEVNNIKNLLALKENELAHFQEAMSAQAAKANSMIKDLQTERQEKDKRIDQLISTAEKIKAENEKLKKMSEEKMEEKLAQISKLEHTLQERSSELLRALEKKDNEMKAMKENFEIEKQNITDSFRQEMKSVQEQQKSELQDRALKIKKSESDIAQRQLDLKMRSLEMDKSLAILQQKLDFLRQQCNDKDQRLTRLQEENAYYCNIFEQKDSQISTISNFFEDFKTTQESNVQDLNNKIEELSQTLAERNKDILKLEQNEEKLKALLREKEQELKYMTEQNKAICKSYEEKLKETNERLTFQVENAENSRRTLEAEIDMLRTENSKSTEEQKRNIELSLVQLKNYYEMQRERLEKKYLESRKKHEQSQSNAIIELENKHRKAQRVMQDEIQQLRTAKEALEEQIARQDSDFEIKMMASEEQRQNQKRMLINRFQLLQKKYSDLQEEFENYERSSEEQRITFVKRIEGLNFDLSRKEKELLQINSKREILETSIKKKEAQIQGIRKNMGIQIDSSLKKVSDIQAKYQRLNEEYMQYKIESDKEIALCRQRNQFLNAKLQDITRQKESISSKNIEKLDKQKIIDLKEQYEKAKAEIISLEAKLESQRRSIREQQGISSKKIQNLESQLQFNQQKEAMNQTKILDLEAKLNMKTESFMKDIDQSRAKYSHQKQILQKQCEDLREKVSVLEDEKSALTWTMQKDIALLNEKIKYCEYQKEQVQKQREEGEKRLQNALQQLKKANEKLSEENDAKRNHSDKKYVGQIEVLRETMRSKENQYEELLRKAKEDNRNLKDKYQELVDRLQSTEKQKTGEKNLQEQIDNLKREKENLMMNYRNERARENEEWKRKNAELDKKCKQSEKKIFDSMFSFEKQSSKWKMEEDRLNEKIKQLQDTLEWERNKNQLNKSKHDLKRAESGNIFSTGSGEFRSFGTGNNWK